MTIFSRPHKCNRLDTRKVVDTTHTAPRAVSRAVIFVGDSVARSMGMAWKGNAEVWAQNGVDSEWILADIRRRAKRNCSRPGAIVVLHAGTNDYCCATTTNINSVISILLCKIKCDKVFLCVPAVAPEYTPHVTNRISTCANALEEVSPLVTVLSMANMAQIEQSKPYSYIAVPLAYSGYHPTNDCLNGEVVPRLRNILVASNR